MNAAVSESGPPAQTLVTGRLEKGRSSKLFLLFMVAVAPYLGVTLINQLRIEWSLNEQYHYGWAVPFLALFCAWRTWTSAKCEGRDAKSEIATKRPESFEPAQMETRPASRSLSVYVAGMGLLFLLLPIRLVQEANSDWRLLSWAMALTVVGIACALTYVAAGPQTLRRYAFALLFILVAVPWPTAVEQFLILHLSAVNTGICVEVLSWFGIPAIQRGNLIELSTGIVEIDAACSGIRSLQAVVMAGLFFGELYRLTGRGRVKVLGIGVFLALLCNVVRTVLLTGIAATRGLATMQSWHDPAGVGILLVCLSGLWAAAELSARKRELRRGARQGGTRWGDAPAEPLGAKDSSAVGSLPSSFAIRPSHLALALCWFGVVELGTAAWYYAKEKDRPTPVVWTFSAPRQETGFTELEISPEARRMLRFEHGEHARWRAGSGATMESFFFDWRPTRAAATLARDHTPEVCLPSAGRQIAANTNATLKVRGLELPFRQFTVPTKNGASYLFYCLWEDRAAVQSNETEFTTMSGRLRSVWQGRRNLGQRVLHVGISGVQSAEQAREELIRTLNHSLTQSKEPQR